MRCVIGISMFSGCNSSSSTVFSTSFFASSIVFSTFAFFIIPKKSSLLFTYPTKFSFARTLRSPVVMSSFFLIASSFICSFTTFTPLKCSSSSNVYTSENTTTDISKVLSLGCLNMFVMFLKESAIAFIILYRLRTYCFGKVVHLFLKLKMRDSGVCMITTTMEWSYSKKRMVSSLERLLEPPKKRHWYEYFTCCYQPPI